MTINYIEDLYLKGSYQVFADETPIGFLNVLEGGWVSVVSHCLPFRRRTADLPTKESGERFLIDAWKRTKSATQDASKQLSIF